MHPRSARSRTRQLSVERSPQAQNNFDVDFVEDALHARDPRARGSAQRVTHYALAIARQMNYSPTDDGAWDRLERGIRLRDLGYIGIGDSVLQKPTELTAEEAEKLHEHTVIGFNLLSGVTAFTDELVIVRWHHERFDGKGYPDGKRGDELPIFAWIVNAADAIDAMTSDRPYRKAMTLDAALEQVREGAGTQFQPDVAQAVLDGSKNGSFKLIPHEPL